MRVLDWIRVGSFQYSGVLNISLFYKNGGVVI